MAEVTGDHKSLLKRVLKIGLKSLAALVFLAVVLVVGAVAAFFLVKEIDIPTKTAHRLIEKYAPASVQIRFDEFNISLLRRKDNVWAKRLRIQTKNFCVQYEKTAVDACLTDLKFAGSFGFGGDLPKEQSRFIPHIIEIEPLIVLGSDINVDLTAFPKDDQPKKSKFDVMSFLRKEVLPKWDVEGNRIQVLNFKIKLSKDSSYSAIFDLQPGDTNGASGSTTIEAILHEVRSLEGPLRARMNVFIRRPESWGADKNDKGVQANIWKILAEGVLTLSPGKEITLKADSNITGFNELDFRIQSFFKGLPVVKEARLEGAVKLANFKGKASAKLGSNGSQLKALDFVNCFIDANLDKKTGGVRCGPQAVRLQLNERSFKRRPDLFVLAPEFDLKITRLSFDDTKSADYSFNMLVDHLGVLRAGLQLKGSVASKESGIEYNVKGRADMIMPEFLRISDFLRRTPYAIPAPLNTLDGAISLRADVDMNQNGGGVKYLASTRLDSRYQAMHLDIDGKTDLVKQKSSLVPETEMTLSILQLAVSAPRFDLRAPPSFKPDSRFGKIDEKKMLKQVVEAAPLPKSKFKLFVKTASPEAIHIATNLTKAPIPISVDVVFDTASKAKSPVSGWVQVGNTPVELFKRNANLETLKVDLLPSGDDRLNGRVKVKYLDYAITILLLGQTSQPQVRFSSDPPLDDNQIISVLLFGRPAYELGDEDKSSVANTKAAITDAVLGISSLYLLASTPVESVGYDPGSGRVTARVGLGGGASLELGAGSESAGQGVGIKKRISREFIFRSDVETVGTTGERTVSALIEWVRRF